MFILHSYPTCYTPIYTPYTLHRAKSLSNGLFFLELVAAIEPRAINWDMATTGTYLRHIDIVCSKVCRSMCSVVYAYIMYVYMYMNTFDET